MIPTNHLLSFNRFYSNPGVDRVQPAFYRSSRPIMMAIP